MAGTLPRQNMSECIPQCIDKLMLGSLCFLRVVYPAPSMASRLAAGQRNGKRRSAAVQLPWTILLVDRGAFVVNSTVNHNFTSFRQY